MYSFICNEDEYSIIGIFAFGRLIDNPLLTANVNKSWRWTHKLHLDQSELPDDSIT